MRNAKKTNKNNKSLNLMRQFKNSNERVNTPQGFRKF